MNLLRLNSFVIGAMEQSDFDSLHDVAFEVFNRSLSAAELKVLVYTFPTSILTDMLANGMDTCVRDEIYEHAQRLLQPNTGEMSKHSRVSRLLQQR